MEKLFQKYFLAANSCEGFASHFADCYRPEDGWRAYIIKGGPGTGKSSFMKYIVAKAQENGLEAELCVCSSDPSSLDGVIIKDKKTVLLDGTSPHIVEPKYAGACEQIINLGQFWDSQRLIGSLNEIIAVTDKNKALHKTASGYLAAAGELLEDNLKIALAAADKKRALDYADYLKKKHIPKTSSKGREWVRFIEGISPVGIVSYSSTITKFYTKKIIIDDKFGAVSDIILKALRADALSKGYEVITLKNPWLPSRLCDHILIPELSLAFATENEYIHFDCDDRRIHSRRFYIPERLNAFRSRTLFNRRTAKLLMLSAAETLSRAKAVHDQMEKFYIGAMDFSKITHLAEKTAKEIING